MKLEDLEIYNLSMDLSDRIWFLVEEWNYFNHDTIGKQWVRAADSISANISEGFGRNTFKDQKNFYYFSRGSLYESKTWLDKARRRSFINEETYKMLLNEHNLLGIKLNNFIKSVNNLMTETKGNK